MEKDNSKTLPQGIVLVDKPVGWTSFDVVARIRSLISKDLRQKYANDTDVTVPKRFKVGHSGTLDPMATGLLVIAVGKATKQIQSLTKLDKIYIVDAILGATSTTGDSEGDISESKSPQPPSKNDVEAVVSSFVGDSMQKPPAYSAIKINGQRAYKLARAGKEVTLEPRPVTIHAISDVSYDWPHLRFTAHVSSGTYIRSLVTDIGSKLNVGGYMSGLRRTAIADFSIEDSIVMSKDLHVNDVCKKLKS